MSNLYTTKTAALKATKADVSKLNTKSLKVNGKDVATSVKHPNDTREVITENDLWCSWAEIKDGEIIFHEDEVVNNPNKVWNINIAKVENNKAYTGEIDFYGALSNLAFCANVQTEKIKGGYNMFSSCANLTTFASDLSSLTIGCAMFIKCDNLTTITSDLSSLINGSDMFHNCSKLTTFTSDLSSLTNGYQMFSGCKLDTESLIHIAETINTVTNKPSIYIGIGNTTPTAEETELLTEIHNKGWQVYVNGTSSGNIFNPTATTPIDGEESITPIPFYAKPVESDEEHAEYIGEDGKFYIILGGNYIFVDDPETYGLFTSLEDAAANMRLTKIEKSEIKKA